MALITVEYKNEKHTVEFYYTNTGMVVKKAFGYGYISIPPGCLHDVETLKPYIIMAIEGKDDFHAIYQLHGTEIL